MVELFPPKQPIQHHITIGGSKSISNRLLLLEQQVNIPFSIQHLSEAEDTISLKVALEKVSSTNAAKIDVQHAGTAMRFLCAYLANKPGSWVLTGSERMKERPIKELVNALKRLGATIVYLEKEGCLPLQITGQPLTGKSITIEAGISSQFISALLLIAPFLKNGLEITLHGSPVSAQYINMTIALMKQLGISITAQQNTISVLPFSKAHFEKEKTDIIVESDWSSASYWYSVCALSPGAKIRLNTFYKQSLQADAVLPSLFDTLGVKTSFLDGTILLEHKKATSRVFEFNFDNSPDIAQTIACCCFGLNIPAKLYGLQTLQLKESKRIEVLKTELEKLGATIVSTADSLFLQKRDIKPLSKDIVILTTNDHRVAMSFAPLSIIYPGLKIDSLDVVAKSYPRFWNDLQSLGFSLNLQP